MSSGKPRRLGRGLEALMQSTAGSSLETDVPGDNGTFRRISIGRIRPNPFQPRKEFAADELTDLKSSLQESGLLQPVTVRPAGRGYELIAGERRLRAAAALGWVEIPAVVRHADDRTLLSLALVENLQRSDLNPVEEAEGYQRLVADFQLTHQQVADVVGKQRSTIANTLRLLNLPLPVQQLLRESVLTAGHARALLALTDPEGITRLAQEIRNKGLSVREVERRVRLDVERRTAPDTINPGQNQQGRPPTGMSPEARSIEDQLRRYLQTEVHLGMTGAERGTLRIPFYSADDLERILDLILGQEREQT